MRFVIQVSSSASVEVDGEIVGKIGRGLTVLVGIGQGDTREIADKMVNKLLGLRIFMDENGKTNLSVRDVGGSLLMVSQFTLYADLRRGNRPGFTRAGDPEMAEEMYEYVMEACRKQGVSVEKGIFGALMNVTLTNEGPFTIILDSDDLLRPKSQSPK